MFLIRMKRKTVFGVLLAVTLCTQAQVITERDAISYNHKLEHRIIYYDVQKQAYSTEIMKGCAQHSHRSIQESVTFWDENNKERTFKPDDALLFYIKKDVYYSLSFKYKNEQKKAFLQRFLVDKKDDLTFYVYYNEADQPIYYFRKSNEGEVYAVADDPAIGYISPIHTLLREKAGSNADIFEPYLDASNMTPIRFQELRKAIQQGNINRIPKFRWGVTANTGIYKLEEKNYDFKSKALASAGIFANIPLFLEFSLNAEALFTKYGFKGTLTGIPLSSVVYNSTEISTPIMLRYTFKYIKGNILPYIQVGYQPSIMIDNKLEYRYLSESFKYERDGNYYTQLSEGQDGTKKFTSALTVGAGIEYILKNNHRLYLDVRGAFISTQLGHSGAAFSVSYNL